jgi:hypothetical protein
MTTGVVGADSRSALRRGVAGLLLVVPVAALLAVGAGGAESSALVLGPLVTYALPVVAVVAFWWDDWPGTRLRASWSGWADTLLIVVAGILLTGVGQALAGGVDLRGIFDASPGPRHVPTFPATLPLAGAAFVALLQLTLVGEGWPLRGLPRIPGGFAALAVAWAVALVVYAVLADVPAPPGSRVVARHGPVAGADLGAALIVISAWQVVIYVLWVGWPLARIRARARRLATGHLVTLGGGIATFLLAHSALGIESVSIAAVTGCLVGAVLIIGMLFEGTRRRLGDLLAAVALAAGLAIVLRAIAASQSFTHLTPDDWVEHAGLNAIAVATILHVSIGRRWPFGASAVSSAAESRPPRACPDPPGCAP